MRGSFQAKEGPYYAGFCDANGRYALVHLPSGRAALDHVEVGHGVDESRHYVVGARTSIPEEFLDGRLLAVALIEEREESG